MRVELLCNLKGDKLWKKGTVLSDAVSPFPRDIQQEIDAGSKVVKVLPSPMERVVDAVAEEPMFVAAEPVNETKALETPSEEFVFPELEKLIEAKGSLAEVSRLFDVTYVTVSRWRKSPPTKPDVLARIKEAARQIDDQSGIDDTASAGSEGTDG